MPFTHVTSLLSAKLVDVRDRRRELDALSSELEHFLARRRGSTRAIAAAPMSATASAP